MLLDNAPLFQCSRRSFLKAGSLILAGPGVSARGLLASMADEKEAALRVGLLTDVHYADRDAAGSRYYRESISKIREAVQRFKKGKIDFAVEMGDFIDAADSPETEIGYLKTISKEFAAADCPRHFVLGNHCVYSLTKEEFLAGCGAKRSYYSFDSGDYHFVVLDACFRSDGVSYGRKNYNWTDPNIHQDEAAWLESDLKKTDRQTLVFVHQRLDVKNHYGIKNAPAVRKILEDSKKTTAVFQGHNHVNDHKEIGGVHYITLSAMVEGSGEANSAYSLLDIMSDGSLRINGFRQQKDYSI